MVTIAEIENLVALARIEVSEEEKTALQKEVSAILEYVSQIKEVSASAISAPEALGVMPPNVMREDTASHESGLYTETVLSAAPKREGDYIKVKKIL